ncbi:hypothetical protein CNMCM5793_000063 [Aspergillus hiratsukae]|uniref:Uncharacterized protein n=1 Tax=Aspergillus hiratsukae TaxID=1194566 RepID=A0A8H6P9Z1_9EURO|nr:hypothetical protein CNMCM5793_000063 [Aspergillus hiratsukae]KAF7160883.1 hypothetical protein CNMCM6106_008257 [Aspergillus hiratsukae]
MMLFTTSPFACAAPHFQNNPTTFHPRKGEDTLFNLEMITGYHEHGNSNSRAGPLVLRLQPTVAAALVPASKTSGALPICHLAVPIGTAAAALGSKRTRFDMLRAEIRREHLAELREGHWDVPEDDEVMGPCQGADLTPSQVVRKEELLGDLGALKIIKEEQLQQKRELQEEIGLWDVHHVPDDDEPVGRSEEGELTAAKAAYKAELLGELQDRKAIKNARVQEKREIEEEIRGLQVRLEAADEALHKARSGRQKVVSETKDEMGGAFADRVSVDFLTELTLPGVHLQVQALFEKKTWSFEDFLSLSPPPEPRTRARSAIPTLFARKEPNDVQMNFSATTPTYQGPTAIYLPFSRLIGRPPNPPGERDVVLTQLVMINAKVSMAIFVTGQTENPGDMGCDAYVGSSKCLAQRIF